MLKFLTGLTAALVLAGPALARTPAEPTPTAPPAAASSVDGIVVEGLPKKSCTSREKDCIAVVVAELKARYPQQLKAFCANWKMQAIRDQWANDQLAASFGGSHQASPSSFGVNAAISKACSPDKPAER
jgi:hypothetical protein